MSRILVIGSNRGIGLELCRQLHGRGDEVIAGCRQSNPELEQIGAEVRVGVDVTSHSALEQLAAEVGPESLDMLIVVAGVLEHGDLEDFDADVVRKQFEVNALGALQTVVALLPCLRRGSKIGLLTSRMGSIADNTSGGSYGYRMSKAALNMAGRSLAHDLLPRGIAVALLHPGYVRTEMTAHHGAIDPPESARGLIARLDELTLQTTGIFVHQSGELLPW